MAALWGAWRDDLGRNRERAVGDLRGTRRNRLDRGGGFHDDILGLDTNSFALVLLLAVVVIIVVVFFFFPVQ